MMELPPACRTDVNLTEGSTKTGENPTQEDPALERARKHVKDVQRATNREEPFACWPFTIASRTVPCSSPGR